MSKGAGGTGCNATNTMPAFGSGAGLAGAISTSPSHSASGVIVGLAVNVKIGLYCPTNHCWQLLNFGGGVAP
eukprot:8206867-Lingulodinium_polyedra.AAC.1